MQITNILSWAVLLINACLFIYLAVQVHTYRHKIRKLYTLSWSSETIISNVQRWRAEDPDNRMIILYLGNKKSDAEGKATAYIEGSKHDIIYNIGIHMHENKVIEDLYRDVIRTYDYAKKKVEDEEESDDDQD